MYRVGIITSQMEFISQNFATKSEAETFILEIAEKKSIKNCRIKNLETSDEEKVDI
jgi:hypothetical protein